MRKAVEFVTQEAKTGQMFLLYLPLNTPHQSGIRAPCSFRLPAAGIRTGAECDALSAHLDLFPTLAEHPEVMAEVRAACGQWWQVVQPQFVNENVVGPTMNPMKELYWRQSGGAQVIVAPAWQGRVRTSTARGDAGDSFGRVNRELIACGKSPAHSNVFGGGNRFWLGPEGGQFSIFVAKGVPFDLEHWFTPASLDTEPLAVVKRSAESVLCRREIQLTNHAGTPFHVEGNRENRQAPKTNSV